MKPVDKKRAVAEAAVQLLEAGTVVGVGTGSTAELFIESLARVRERVDATVASSQRTADRLRERGLRVIDLADAGRVPIYVDGADEATDERHLIKGGGGALTREKIVAAASDRFICIVDDSKRVERLGAFPLPIEVIPMAVQLVGEELRKLGGDPRPRAGVTTDNGNCIVDVHRLIIQDPVGLEGRIDHIVGTVANGLFCRRPADLLLIGTETGVVQVGA
jgi:ribose 5-phosphate isomerase A